MMASTWICRDESRAKTRPNQLLTKPVGMPGDILVPEETVFGIISRYHALSGHRTARDTLRGLLSRHTASLSTSFPSGLNLIFQHLPLPLNTVEDLIENHTVLPYFRTFANPAHYAHVAHSVSMGAAYNAKITLGLLASRLGAEEILRFCPACAEADVYVIGIATWYRVHQLPGVLLCPYHGVPLIENRCLVQRLRRQQLFLPEIALGWADNSNVTIDEHVYEKLLLVARLSAQLLEYRREPFEVTAWRDQCFLHLFERGLATETMRIRQIELRHQFLNFWSDLKCLAPFCKMLERCKEDDSWLANLCRRPRSAHHPLLHLLLIGFLAKDINSFFNTSKKRSAIELISSISKPIAVETKIASLVAGGMSLRQIAKEMRVSVNSVLVKAEKIGVVVQRRSKKLNPDLILQVRLCLEAGESIQDIVRATKLSASTVNRILGANSVLQNRRAFRMREKRQESARTNFLRAIASVPTAGFKELQTLLGPDFAWLYRHDRDWLYDHIPSSAKNGAHQSPVNWNVRDSTFANEVGRIVSEIRQAVGSPVRVSVSEIGRRTDNVSWLDKSLTKLPKTCALISVAVEPVSEFQMRRLVWYEQHLDCKYTARWRIVRAAGLKFDPAEKSSKI